MERNFLATGRQLRSSSAMDGGIKAWLRSHGQRARLLLGLSAVTLACAIPGVASAQHCRQHYTEAFQVLSSKSFAGQSPDAVKQAVIEAMGPRRETCGENGYKVFLTGLGTQASAAFRKKGAEQEANLAATRELMNHFPLQVRFGAASTPRMGIAQLRSDLGVLATEVGATPGTTGILDTLAKLPPPKALARPMPKDDDEVPITVPRIPLPGWAIISLYEIRDHAARKETPAIAAKTARILEWVARVAPPLPANVAPAKPAAPAPAPAVQK